MGLRWIRKDEIVMDWDALAAISLARDIIEALAERPYSTTFGEKDSTLQAAAWYWRSHHRKFVTRLL